MAASSVAAPGCLRYQFNKKEKQILSVLRHKEKKQLVIEPVE